MDWGFKLLKTTALVLLGGFNGFGHYVDAFNDDRAFLGLNAQDTTCFVAVFALTNLDGIATLERGTGLGRLPLQHLRRK